MKKLLARYLLQFSTEELWNILVGGFLLQFDDGVVIETNDKEVLYSSYFWDFHRIEYRLPLLSTHHVSSVLKGGYLNNKTHTTLLENIFWDLVDTCGLTTPELKDPYVKLIYVITNNLYNDLTQKTEDYVMSIDILDFIKMVDTPAIKTVMDDIKPTKQSIINANRTIIDTINKDKSLDSNNIAVMSRIGVGRIGQVLQCVGPRGYPTDVDGTILPVPVTRGYIYGLRSFYNYLAESRGAAKSLMLAEDPLQQAEYFARRLQLIVISVEKIEQQDCGSTDYLLWRIKPPNKVNGVVVYPGDLNFMVGKYYLDEETNTLKVLSKKDTHLYGKIVKIRSVIYCKHPNKHGVCKICFGQLADNISSSQNVGHVCATTMTQQTTQIGILSVKHHDSSAISESIQLNEQTQKIFQIGRTGNTYYLKKDLAKKPLTITVTQSSCFGLTDILLINDINNFSPSRVSGIHYLGVTIGDNKEPEIVYVEKHGKPAILTKEFLDYAKKQKWTIDSKSNFVFDMSKWDFNKPLLKTPITEYNYSQHSKEIANVIEAKIKNLAERMRPESPANTLIELFDLVNSKLNVNLALLEVIIYAIMVDKSKEFGFGMARNAENPALGISGLTITKRSLGALYAYQNQHKVIADPKSFYMKDRPDSPMDVFINPHEVVEAYKDD